MNKKILLLAILFFIPIWKTNAQTLELSDINIKLDLDDDFITFTRNNLSDNPNLSKFQLTEQSMKSKFIDNDIYVDAILNNKLEFILQVTEADLENINNLSYCNKNELKEILNDYKDVTTIKSASIYENKYKFISTNQFSNNYHVLSYYTIVNGNSYKFWMQSREEISQDEKKYLSNAINSVIFTENEEKKNCLLETNSNINKYLFSCIKGAIIGIVSYMMIIFLKKIKKLH
mgnify:FL=1